MHSFSPEQFVKWPAEGQLDTDLRSWLRRLPIEERVPFLEQTWNINATFALSLAKTSQLPIPVAVSLLEKWLLGQPKHAQHIIQAFVPLLGERKFWQVVGRVPVSASMASMLAYQRGGA